MSDKNLTSRFDWGDFIGYVEEADEKRSLAISAKDKKECLEYHKQQVALLNEGIELWEKDNV